MKGRYYGSKIGRAGAPANISVEELERRWLCSVGSATNENVGIADLWIQACIAQSVPVSKYVDQNKRSFYAMVIGTP